MSDIHCGVTKVPKGKKLGSMMECAEKSQVRYYGLKRIDPKILEAAQKQKSKPATRENLMMKHVEINARKKKLTASLEKEKDKIKKGKIEKDLKKALDQLKAISKDLKIIEAKREKEKQQKKANSKQKRPTKKATKRTTRRKTK